MLERQLVPVLLQILCGGTGLVLWPNPQGYDSVRKVKYGVGRPGGADYIGLCAGVPVAVEFKTPKGRQSEDQKRFERLWTGNKGVYAICRSEEDCRELLAQLRGEHPSRVTATR